MILTVDASGEIVGTHDHVPHPAPADMLARLAAHAAAQDQRTLDVPPLTSAGWHVPAGADAPVPKRAIAVEATRTSVVADESEVLVLSGLPEGATVGVVGPEGMHGATVEGGRVAVSFAAPGMHEIRVGAPGHRTATVQVEARRPPRDHRPRRLRGAEKRLPHLASGHATDRLAEAAIAAIDALSADAHRRHGAALAAAPMATAVASGDEPAPEFARIAAARGIAPGDHATDVLASRETFWAGEEARERAKARIKAIAASGGRRHELEAAAGAVGIDIHALPGR